MLVRPLCDCRYLRGFLAVGGAFVDMTPEQIGLGGKPARQRIGSEPRQSVGSRAELLRQFFVCVAGLRLFGDRFRAIPNFQDCFLKFIEVAVAGAF